MMDRRNFIRLSGVAGIAATGMAISGISPFVSCSPKEKGFEEQVRQYALLAFKRFEEVWDFSDFWKRGNTFDACLVFAQAAHQQWPNDPQIKQMSQKIVVMLAQNLEFFYAVNFGAMWADDFGWWGLMALNARKLLLQLNEQELADKYWTLADESCWLHKKNVAYDHSKEASPVPHGCRNGDANGESLGVKNTVTNVLLFLLSTRIYRVAKAENRADTDKYLEMAYAQWQWFSAWFKLEDYEFLKQLTGEGALVQERPMAEFEGSTYTEKIHPPWAEGWVWSGDQGMIVAAICDMIAIKDDLAQYISEKDVDSDFNVDEFNTEAFNVVHLIAKGVKNALVSDADGIVREAPCLSSFGPVHGRDYVAGRGILMRYFGETQTKSFTGINLDKALSVTAQAIWDTRDVERNQFQPEYTSLENDKLYIKQFSEKWGLADEVYQWNLDTMKEKNKHGVCQAMGLDIIGAAIRTLSANY